jgi:hypothetical protein
MCAVQPKRVASMHADQEANRWRQFNGLHAFPRFLMRTVFASHMHPSPNHRTAAGLEERRLIGIAHEIAIVIRGLPREQREQLKEVGEAVKIIHTGIEVMSR